MSKIPSFTIQYLISDDFELAEPAAAVFEVRKHDASPTAAALQ
jgi:hypothetical protein